MTDASDHHAALDAARRWLAAEPDDDLRAELADLIDGPVDALVERFTGRLQFGTAGLRGIQGGGQSGRTATGDQEVDHVRLASARFSSRLNRRTSGQSSRK